MQQGKKLNQERGLSIPVDLIRTLAIVGVILLHAANDLTIQQMGQLEIVRWWTVDIYQSLGRVGVPLFVMLTGALLLQPSKNESISVFFKKRWARIGLPFIFWGAIYFAYDFLVLRQAITTNAIVQGILTGPYYHFWYLYMLMGLYLLTPILRILIAHADDKIMKYFVILWFLGASIIPFAGLLTTFHLDSNVLTITGMVGYFVLGAVLLTVKMRRSVIAIIMAIGMALTVIGTYALAATIGGGTMFFFQEYFSPTLILASVMLFLLLTTLKPPEENKEVNPSKSNKLLNVISQNTLPIFLFHVMVLESLQYGYFGFAINGNTINSIIGVPLITAVTLFICLAVIIPLKKVPLLKQLIG
jgi:surface polysaccharide O-acyltransferase-like enzyme